MSAVTALLYRDECSDWPTDWPTDLLAETFSWRITRGFLFEPNCPVTIEVIPHTQFIVT